MIAYTWYGLLKFNRKKKKKKNETTRSTIDHFLIFGSKKNKSPFSLMVNYCNQKPHF